MAVAEGVENQDLFDRMVAFESDVLQGYHLARPLTGKDLVAAVLAREIAHGRRHLADGLEGIVATTS